MKVYNFISSYKFHDPVVTIGTFDGVHRGHVQLLNRLCEISGKLGTESVVITLWPHPQMVLRPEDNSFKLLNTLNEKLAQFENACVNNLIIVPFTKEIAKMSSEEFIKNILVERIKAKHLLVGYDNQIGRNREGDINQFKELGKRFGFEVDQFDQVIVGEQKISSTVIRRNIEQGNIENANLLLGYPYSLTGIVVEGNKLGRTIGFPTANLQIGESYKLLPKDGVYAVLIQMNGLKYKGMLNIGLRPTVNSNELKRTIETHIFNFDDNLYKHEITISFVHRIRDEIKFNNFEELTIQLNKDRDLIQKLLLN